MKNLNVKFEWLIASIVIGFLVASHAVGFDFADLSTIPWENGWFYFNIVFWFPVVIWWGLVAIWNFVTASAIVSVISSIIVILIGFLIGFIAFVSIRNNS